ncbi:MAG: hypothetical protein ACP5HM_13340 [Anaerolineae bacterium]
MRDRASVIALLLCAFLLRVWQLGAQSLWYDEAYIWWVTTDVSWARMLALSAREIIPPAYYVLMRLWTPLAGVTEFALRFPSALLGMLGVAAGGRLVGRLTGSPRARDVALVLLTLGTPLLWAAREVRMYGPLLTWTLVADAAWVELLMARTTPGRRRWAWIWGAATLLGLYTLVLTAFWLLGQGLFALLFLSRGKKGRLLPWLRALAPVLALVALLTLPWALTAAHYLGENAGYWTGYLPLPTFLRTAARGMTLSDFWPAAGADRTASLVLAASVLGVILALRRPRRALYPLCYALPVLLLGLIFQVLPKWGTRHAVLFAPAPPLGLALAWGLHPRRPLLRRFSRWLLGAATLFCVGIWLRADAYLLFDPAFAHEDWRGAVHYVQRERSPDDVVIVETGSVFPAWAYYGGRQGLLPLPDDDLLNVNHVLHYGNTAPALNAVLPETANVWLVQWLSHVTDPTDLVAALLAHRGTEQPTPDFHGLTVRRFEISDAPRLPPKPPTTARPRLGLLPHLELWGYTLPQTNAPPDHPLSLWTWWVTDDPSAHKGAFYQILVRLLDANGDEWGRVDTTPGGGDYRPERWPVMTPVLGPVELPVDPWAPPGVYTPTLTLYTTTQRSAERSLGTVTLARPGTPPTLPPEARSVVRQGEKAALELLGVHVEATDIMPCGALTGRLFWKIVQLPESAYRLTLSVGPHQQTLEPAPDFAAQSWAVGDHFATPFHVPIDCRALDQTEALHISLTPADLEAPAVTWTGPEISVKAGRIFAAPDDLLPLEAHFGDGFATLVGYRLDPPKIRANVPFTLTLVWRAGVTGETPYTAFVHVTRPESLQPIAQHDSWPRLGGKPTHTWVPGEIVVDPHPLPALSAGDYTLRIGFYDPSGVRLQRAEFATVADNVPLVLHVFP